jgi:hypothetical protein
MQRQLLAGLLTSLAFALVSVDPVCSAEQVAKPKIVSIKVTPSQLELTGVRDGRRLLVVGRTANGTLVDLSNEAKSKPLGKQVRIDRDGFIVGVSKGTTKVTVTAGGKSVDVPVTVTNADAKTVSFIGDVMPILSRVGCNAGTCHGARIGKGGFKLSLRGYDSLYDYRALVDDISGRRFNRSQPSQSLMLLKPTQAVPHEGGFLFDEQSRAYKLIEQWIAEGCKYEKHAKVESIAILPEKPLLQVGGDRQQQIVIARFSDGSTRDVTREAIYEISDFEVATVGKTGEITAVRRGEAAALVRYQGAYATNPITVIGRRPGYKWSGSPEHNYIDSLVNAKLQRMKILSSGLCTDAEFLRRVSLDLTGVPPAAKEVRAFLADKRHSRVKRDAKIDDLLSSSGYIDHWTLKWSDLLMSNRKFIGEKGVWAFRNWIRHAVATNRPYDEFVYDLMTANGSTFEKPAANYYRIAREPKIVMENMTQVFMGTRFMCAQCHDHPFERWTQTQYYTLAAYFAAVGRKKGPIADEEIIYSLKTAQPVVHVGTGQPVKAEFPYELEGLGKPSVDPRVQLGRWLTAPQNPLFAKSLVNRYWSYFMGRGLIDPVDDIRSSNPATDPELLAALEADFLKGDFDLKRLIHTIVTSHSYQRSYRTNEFNKNDLVNNSHALPRRLTAEQLFDTIMIATEAPVNIPGVPAGFRATQLPDSQIKLSFLDMFGRPPRESPCECERSSEVSLKQTLNLVNGPTVADALIHPQGLIARRIREKATDAQLVDDIYVGVLCRKPSADELKNAVAYIAEVGNQQEAAQDLMWALINSSAFLFNR